jgi:hypothetical protein
VKCAGCGQLPSGPAFIQVTKHLSPGDRNLILCGYEWRDATIGTAAGWVRPSYRTETTAWVVVKIRYTLDNEEVQIESPDRASPI